MKINWRLRERAGRVVEMEVQMNELEGLLIVPIMFLSKSKLNRNFPSLSIMIKQRFEVESFSRGGEWYDPRSLTTVESMGSHEESRRSRLLAEDRRLRNLTDSVDRIPRFRSTESTKNSTSRLRTAAPGHQLSQFRFPVSFLDDF